MTTGAAATSRFARRYTAAATQNNTTPTKNTRRPSRSRSRNAPTTRRAKLLGKENEHTFLTANSYASSLLTSGRFEEVKSLLCDLMPLARRTLGEGHELTLKMRKAYARALYENKAATLDDLHEAVTTLEDSERIARRVFGNAHPNTAGIEHSLRNARAALRDREAQV